MAQQVKNLSAVQETQGTRFNPWVRKIPFLEEAMATDPSILTGKPMDRGRLQSMGSQRVGHD